MKKTTPGFAVYGYNVYSPTFYTDLGENTIQVLLELPDNIAKDVSGNDNDFAVTLTAASEKYFTITDQTLVSGSEAVTLSKKGVETELSNALLITLRADKNKGAGVQFAIQSSRFASGGTVNSKKLTVTAAKAASKLSLKFVDNNTGSAVTSYTLMKGKSEKEYISVTPTLSTTQGGRLEYYTKIEGTPGNLNIRTALDEDDNIYYTIMAENEDFFSSMKSVSLKYTTYVKSSTSNSGWVKLATKTLTLKKSKTADTTVTLKVKGSLNVVSPQSAVTITPTFKNMPQNATIYSVNFTNSADAKQYYISADLSTGVVTLTKAEDAGALPIAKDSIGLTYKIRLADGSIKEVSKAATVNVVQTATVKASTSSATLYNVSTGTNYGKTVALNVTKAEGASIETIEISGLDGSGISYQLNGDDTVTFYTDGTISRGVAKTYTAKMTVTLEGCGTKKSKPVTYTVSVKLALKK
ncbi:MAG: hypothetical protein LIO86_11100 [Lachnospiraceae bacterium]|nr:hypothetical protein [Lachnospiraceae bacterium]